MTLVMTCLLLCGTTALRSTKSSQQCARAGHVNEFLTESPLSSHSCRNVSGGSPELTRGYARNTNGYYDCSKEGYDECIPLFFSKRSWMTQLDKADLRHVHGRHFEDVRQFPEQELAYLALAEHTTMIQHMLDVARKLCNPAEGAVLDVGYCLYLDWCDDRAYMRNEAYQKMVGIGDMYANESFTSDSPGWNGSLANTGFERKFRDPDAMSLGMMSPMTAVPSDYFSPFKTVFINEDEYEKFKRGGKWNRVHALDIQHILRQSVSSARVLIKATFSDSDFCDVEMALRKTLLANGRVAGEIFPADASEDGGSLSSGRGVDKFEMVEYYVDQLRKEAEALLKVASDEIMRGEKRYRTWLSTRKQIIEYVPEEAFQEWKREMIVSAGADY